MKIECLGQRPGGTKADIDGIEYHFAPLADGAHVAKVSEEAHIDRFLSISDHYKVYHGKEDVTEAPVVLKNPVQRPALQAKLVSSETLYGSSVHESSYEIGGVTYLLGDIVAKAHETSGLTVEEWNELEDEERHAKIDITLDDLAEAAEKAEPAPEGDERAALVEQYKAKFGKAPHYKASIETIKAKLAE